MILTFISSVLVPGIAQKVGVLNGPSGIPCAYLMEKVSKGRSFEVFATAQTELPKLINGELDIGFLPPNVAAKVYTKNKGSLICLGITGNGNLYVIAKDGTKDSGLSELEGKTVYCAGQGATPEYLMTYLLKKINVKNVSLDFSIPNPQIAPCLIQGTIDYALVPEPFPTVAEMNDSSVVRLVDMQKVFDQTNGGTYPITVLVVNAKYAKKNRSAINRFISDLQKAINWTIKNPKDAGVLVEKNGLGLKAAVAEKAIPKANYTWINASQSQESIESLLKIFLEISPESIGGSLPDKGFYFN